jgi:hypothetical protein
MFRMEKQVLPFRSIEFFIQRYFLLFKSLISQLLPLMDSCIKATILTVLKVHVALEKPMAYQIVPFFLKNKNLPQMPGSIGGLTHPSR